MVVSFEDKYSELVSTALEELKAKTNITQMTPGGKARSLLEIVMRETANAYNSFSTDMLQAFVKHAEGRNLDAIGEMLGLTRTPASRNLADSNSQVQKFFVRNGTFADINGGVGFTIPAGTIVQTRSASTDEQPIRYLVIEDVTCSAAASSAYATIQAIEFGSDANVGAGRLNVHDFEQYTDYLNETLKTTNIEGVVFGTDIENDTNYRYRITQQTLSSEAANATAIRLAALSVPGVADVLLDEYSRGIGSGAVYIKSVVPTVSELLISTVQDVLDRSKAFGNFVEARQPILIGTEMVVKLNLYDIIPASERAELIEKVRSRIYQYINGLDINEDLEVDLLVREILNADSNIKSIGTPSRPIDQLYIWKYSASEDSRVRYTAIDGYDAKNFERIVTEFSEMIDSADPITVLINIS